MGGGIKTTRTTCPPPEMRGAAMPQTTKTTQYRRNCQRPELANPHKPTRSAAKTGALSATASPAGGAMEGPEETR
eukprot:696351-Lingulodinium_polyedra.AAC.1